MKNKLNKFIAPVVGIALLGAGALAAGVTGVASAATSAVTGAVTTAATQIGQGMAGQHGDMGRPAVQGTISSISGDTIVVADQQSGTSYTVDATNAKILKASDTAPTAGTKPTAPATVTISDLAVGDTVAVQGTTSGTNVTATDIMDGKFMGGRGGFGGPGGIGGGAMGTVSAINGTTLTVTTKDGGTYTVDASSATVRASGSTSAVSDIKVGDTVRIDGTVTTASMTAKNIDDGIPTPPAQSSTTSSTTSTSSN